MFIVGLWRQLSRGVRALIHPRAADADARDEIHDYLRRAAAEHRGRGLSSDDAARAATLEIGNATVVREEVRVAPWEHRVETALADVRYALRRLRHAPAFTATAVATLALGIGASTTVFSAASPIFLEPLPFPHGDRLVTVDDRNDEDVPMPAAYGTYVELRARAHSFDALASADAWQPTLIGSGPPQRLDAQRVTAGYFDVFGAHPIAGRGFAADDDTPGAPNVVIISDGLLERRFGGDRAIVGRTIELDGDPYVVIGVMPAGFSNLVDPAAVLWSPLRARLGGDFGTREWGHHYRIVGRLSATADVAAAEHETRDIGRAAVPFFPRPVWADLKRGLVVRSLGDAIAAPVRPSLFAIAGAVALLLAIALVNVVNLVVGHGARRTTEFAMRVALGAGAGRLARQLLTESLVLATTGGALGLAAARIGIRALVASSPPGLPRADAIHLDPRVFLFALALTTLVGLVVGLAPALRAARTDATDGLHRGSHRATAGRGGVRNALVVAEMALALVLVVCAGLLLRSVDRLLSTPPGFDPSHVVTMQVVEAGHAFDTDTTRYQFFEQALGAVRAVPGVERAAFASGVPLNGTVDGYGYEIQSQPGLVKGAAGNAVRFTVTPDYFAAMGIPLRRGRLLDAGDRPGAPEAVVVTESMARRAFNGANPIGQRIRFGPEMGGGHWDVVVGVVPDVKAYSLAVAAPDAFYVASGQWSWVDNVQTLVVRTTGDPAALVPSLRRAVWSVNANQPIQRVATMEQLVTASAGQRRFALLVIEVFALAALGLAAVGLYGVVAGQVAERTREIGIRAALGATSRDIVRRIVGRGVALALIGVAIGLGGAFAASRLLASLLFSVSRLDPAAYGGAALLLLAVAALASWVPARRAARVDPAITLRAE